MHIGESPRNNLTPGTRLKELESMPRRNPALHWAAFVLSLLSLIILGAWVFSSQGPVSLFWILADIGLGAVFTVEYFTRSGFRWDRTTYLRTHIFDFIAIVPALAIVNHGLAIQGVWVWLILVARFARVVDRFLGDGFIRRNLWALIEGVEEELTDRIMERIITRVQADMDRANFSKGVSEILVTNKAAILQRVRAATPHEGLMPFLAHIAGLDAVLEHAEERTYDAMVEIINSKEVDSAVREVVNSTFSRMRTEIGRQDWKQHLGIRR
jgi:hypothetical protein